MHYLSVRSFFLRCAMDRPNVDGVKALLLAMSGIALLSGCVTPINYREVYDTNRARWIRQWGPEKAWTAEQTAAYMRGLPDGHGGWTVY